MPHRRLAVASRGLVVLIAVLAAGCGDSHGGSAGIAGPTADPPVHERVHVVRQFPHDREAFTQGLVWAGNDELYESTGLRGESSLRRVAIPTGETSQTHSLDAPYFGEGLALVDDRLIQLTWQEHTAFVYQASTFEQTATFDYTTEGWGLCHDGSRLVMSDGTATLTFRDPDTFEPLGTTGVVLDGKPLSRLNELECVGDRVYANVLGDDNIYEIDPSKGTVTTIIDASGLNPDANEARGEVLNGIAYDPVTGHFYITGKNWPTLFEVTFEPVS